jgi:hypothetical protein
MAVLPVTPPPLELGRKVVAFVGDKATESALRTGLAVLDTELDLRRGARGGVGTSSIALNLA